MKDRFNELLQRAKTIFLEKPRYFYLNFLRVFSALFFWLFMMFTFYRVSFLSQTARFNVFGLKASFLYVIVFLAIPFVIAFFAIKENKKNLNLTILISSILSILYFLLAVLIYIGDRNSNTYIDYRLGLGFYLLLLDLILIVILNFKSEFAIKLLEKYLKFKHDDIVEAEIVDQPTKDEISAAE